MGLVLAVAMVLPIPNVLAQMVDLGSASGFAVLAGSGITIGASGTTAITGDIGSYPTATITGTENLTLTGINHGGDAVTQDAKTDLAAAYAAAAGRTPTTTYAPIYDLGGQTLAPGVYNDPSSFGITGVLTLDAGGDPDAVWIFQAGSTLTTASGSQVALINGAQASHVFWQVGTSATLGTGTDFAGTILAVESITLVAGATVEGRALALNGVVTLDDNAIALGALLGDRAWYDADADGIQDGTETLGFTNWPVALLGADSNEVASTTTDTNGCYLFQNVPPGTYIVRFSVGSRLISPADQGGDDALDSDGASTNGGYAYTDPFEVFNGVNNLTVDLGLPVDPTRVALYSFSVADEGGGVVVHWRTASEEDSVGFYVERETGAGRMRVNDELLYAQGEDGFGASYALGDPGAAPGGTYTYWLVEIESDGGQQLYGPFTRTATALELERPIVSGADGVQIRWLGHEGETYHVLRSTNLLEGMAGFHVIASGLPAAPERTEFLDPGAGPAVFYLIQVDDE